MEAMERYCLGLTGHLVVRNAIDEANAELESSRKGA